MRRPDTHRAHTLRALVPFAAGHIVSVAVPCVALGFVMSTAHGAGLALVPALMPFCTGGATASKAIASEVLTQAIGAVLLHAVAMLAVTGLIAAVAQRVGRWVPAGLWAWPTLR